MDHTTTHPESRPANEPAKKAWVTPAMQSVAVMETYNTSGGASGDGVDPQYS